MGLNHCRMREAQEHIKYSTLPFILLLTDIHVHVIPVIDTKDCMILSSYIADIQTPNPILTYIYSGCTNASLALL